MSRIPKVEKGIPIPTRKSQRWKRYPFPEMEVGDSFLVSREDGYKAQSAAHEYGSRCGVKFCTRRLEIGLRVWRIK